MGVFGWVGKTVKRETGFVAGWTGVTLWWQSARTSWLSFRRRCPACGEGRLFPFVEEIQGVAHDFYGCSKCDHFQTADLSDERDEAVADSLGRLRRIVSTRIDGLSRDEALRLQRRLKSNSRYQYFFSVVLLVTGVTLLEITGSAWPLMNSTALGALLFVHGLRSSYRYWQVCNNVFFQPGAFRRWLGLGQWLV